MSQRPIPLRAALLIPGGLALLAGLNGALQLLGVAAPVQSSRLADGHGLLMTLGFVATLVSLERSVALGKLWGYLSPAALGMGALMLILPTPGPANLPRVFLLVGMVMMCVNYLPLWRRNRDESILVQALGSVMGTVAALLVTANLPIRVLVVWLAGFVILTIFGERLELSRMVLTHKDSQILLALALIFVCAATMALLWPLFGYPMTGLSLIVMTAWLASRDVASKLVRTSGVRRFMAACMLAGYLWLLVAGGVWLLGPAFDGERYDAVIHSVFLGFTISMIMAHASTILPAVIRRPLPYRSLMWAPAILLHGSLVLRVWLGDGMALTWAHTWGGVLNVAAVLGFVVVAVGSAAVGTKTAKSRPTTDATAPQQPNRTTQEIPA